MAFKFEKLEVWQLSLEYLDQAYEIAGMLPASENHNLRSQLTRAATSIVLAIAEGSTGQTDREQTRFLGIAVRSAIETVACLHVVHRRQYVRDKTVLRRAYLDAEELVAKLTAMRKSLDPDMQWVREPEVPYLSDNELCHPFD